MDRDGTESLQFEFAARKRASRNRYAPDSASTLWRSALSSGLSSRRSSPVRTKTLAFDLSEDVSYVDAHFEERSEKERKREKEQQGEMLVEKQGREQILPHFRIAPPEPTARFEKVELAPSGRSSKSPTKLSLLRKRACIESKVATAKKTETKSGEFLGGKGAQKLALKKHVGRVRDFWKKGGANQPNVFFNLRYIGGDGPDGQAQNDVMFESSIQRFAVEVSSNEPVESVENPAYILLSEDFSNKLICQDDKPDFILEDLPSF